MPTSNLEADTDGDRPLRISTPTGRSRPAPASTAPGSSPTARAARGTTPRRSRRAPTSRSSGAAAWSSSRSPSPTRARTRSPSAPGPALGGSALQTIKVLIDGSVVDSPAGISRSIRGPRSRSRRASRRRAAYAPVRGSERHGRRDAILLDSRHDHGPDLQSRHAAQRRFRLLRAGGRPLAFYQSSRDRDAGLPAGRDGHDLRQAPPLPADEDLRRLDRRAQADQRGPDHLPERREPRRRPDRRSLGPDADHVGPPDVPDPAPVRRHRRRERRRHAVGVGGLDLRPDRVRGGAWSGQAVDNRVGRSFVRTVDVPRTMEIGASYAHYVTAEWHNGFLPKNQRYRCAYSVPGPHLSGLRTASPSSWRADAASSPVVNVTDGQQHRLHRIPDARRDTGPSGGTTSTAGRRSALTTQRRRQGIGRRGDLARQPGRRRDRQGQGLRLPEDRRRDQLRRSGSTLDKADKNPHFDNLAILAPGDFTWTAGTPTVIPMPAGPTSSRGAVTAKLPAVAAVRPAPVLERGIQLGESAACEREHVVEPGDFHWGERPKAQVRSRYVQARPWTNAGEPATSTTRSGGRDRLHRHAFGADHRHRPGGRARPRRSRSPTPRRPRCSRAWC